MWFGKPKEATGSSARFLERVLFLIAFLAFGYVGWVALDRLAFQRIESERLAQFVPAQPAAASGGKKTAAPKPAENDVIGRLSIPTGQIDAIIAEGVNSRTLRRAIGHIPSTALPGEPGNVALAGHRDTFFRGLEKIHLNDPILLLTSAGTYDYLVEDIRVVEPSDTQVLAPGPTPTLTLVTCYPFNFVGAAPQRYIVRAREVGRPAAFPPNDEPTRH